LRTRQDAEDEWKFGKKGDSDVWSSHLPWLSQPNIPGTPPTGRWGISSYQVGRNIQI
jgi:hypothetical protein